MKKQRRIPPDLRGDLWRAVYHRRRIDRKLRQAARSGRWKR